MTIVAAYSPQNYAGDGSTASFSTVFVFQNPSDVVVHLFNNATQASVLQVLGVNYMLVGGGSPASAGTVTMFVAPAIGYALKIERDIPLTQLTHWQQNDAYPANANRMENGLDKLTMALQGAIANPFDLGGTAATFLRGDNTLSNTLIGPLGAFTLPADTTALFTAGQNANASIKVVGGASSQSAFSFGVSGSANPWDARWVYDPGIGEIGWQFYGGPILGTFDNAGNVSISGTYTGSADASLITTGTVAPARLGSGSGSANVFLNGLGQFTIPAGGGGGINTTTTGTFTIAAVNSTQTVPVTSVTGIVVGTQLQIGDGTHIVNGHVTNIASLNLTVKTDSIPAGTAGNTMASGAAVQGSTFPGTNSVFVQDASSGPFSATTLFFSGNLADVFSASTVSICLNGTGSTYQVVPYISAGTLKPNALWLGPGGVNAGLVGFTTNAASTSSVIFGTAQYQVPVVTGYSGGHATSIGWQLLDANSITPGSLTPPLLQATNSPSAGQIPSYADSTHFTWVANTGLPTATNTGQFLRGDGAYSNVLNLSASSGEAANKLLLARGVIDGSFGTELSGSTDGTQAYWIAQKRISGTWGTPTGVTTNYLIGSTLDGSVLSVGQLWSSIDSGVRENIYSPAAIRTGTALRDVYGPLHLIFAVDMTGLSGVTIDLANGAYQRLTGFTNDGTITLTDSTPLPSNSAFRYESELTLELVSPGTHVTGWAASGGSVVGANGATMPTGAALAAAGKNVVKFIRSQDQTYWIGEFIGTAAGTGTVTSIGASLPFATFTGPVTTSGTLTGTWNSQSTNTFLAAPVSGGGAPTFRTIAVSDLPSAGFAGGSFTNANITVDNRGRVTAASSGSGGGGGSFDPNAPHTWGAVQTYSANNIFNAPQTLNGQTNGSGSFAITGLGATDGSTYWHGIDMNVLSESTQDSSGGSGNIPMVLGMTVNRNTSNAAAVTGFLRQTNGSPTAAGWFNVTQVIDTYCTRLSGGSSDAIFYTTNTPNIFYQGTTDPIWGTPVAATGAVSGSIRVGEVNYGNSWVDFGLEETRGIGSYVCGIEFFPQYTGGYPTNFYSFDAQWAIAVGNGGINTGLDGRYALNHIGVLIDKNSISAAGYGLRLWGSVGTFNGASESTNAPYALIKMSGSAKTGIDFAGTNGDSTPLTATNTGAAVITMADDQSIKLGSIWLRGHATGSHLQYSTDGSSWSDFTLP